jgi:hypothetical protein
LKKSLGRMIRFCQERSCERVHPLRDITNPEPDHLARAQTCAVAESEQYVNLEIPRHGQDVSAAICEGNTMRRRPTTTAMSAIDGAIVEPRIRTKPRGQPRYSIGIQRALAL